MKQPCQILEPNVAHALVRAVSRLSRHPVAYGTPAAAQG
jgi:hypothetical protein